MISRSKFSLNDPLVKKEKNKNLHKQKYDSKEKEKKYDRSL